MHYSFRKIGLLLTFWVLITTTVALADETPLPIISAEYGKNVWVIDGDTIHIGEFDETVDPPEYVLNKIRLGGIDAPEINQTCGFEDDRFEADCGFFARSNLSGILESEKTINCHITRADEWQGSGRDRYRRLRGKCYVGKSNMDVQQTLVREGWAVAFYTNDYKADERQARRASRGLWSGEFQRPSEFRKDAIAAKFQPLSEIFSILGICGEQNVFKAFHHAKNRFYGARSS